jgi:hypothetical protein
MPLGPRTATKHPETLEGIVAPLVVASLPFSVDPQGLIDRISTYRYAKNTYNPENFANAKRLLTDYQAGKKVRGRVADVEIQRSWINGYKLYKGKVKVVLSAFLTFGEFQVTPIHIEELAACTFGALVRGEKQWKVWEPNQDVRNAPAAYEFVQKEGWTAYVPGGWPHTVTTLTPFSILLGETIVTKSSVHSSLLIARQPVMRQFVTTKDYEEIAQRLKIKISKRSMKKKRVNFAGHVSSLHRTSYL